MSTNVFDMTDKVVIVTGASSGLGDRFARVLHDAGATVVLAARRAERLQALGGELVRSLPVACDVTKDDDCDRLVQATMDAYQRIDVLINNAGTAGDAVPAEVYPRERWDQTISINLSGLFQLTQRVAVEMLSRQSGSIVNVASTFGLVAASPVNDAAYAASKGAVVNLTRELAVEWAPKGIRVNALAPGWFPSELTSGMIDDESSQQYVRRGSPMKRMGREGELDGAILFLASDASSYCTGHTLVIDGGWTAH